MMCLWSVKLWEDGYQYDYGDGTSEAPDEFVIDGDPAEVGVPVPLWVQAHGQTCSQQGGKQHHGLVTDELLLLRRDIGRKNQMNPFLLWHTDSSLCTPILCCEPSSSQPGVDQ